MKPAEREELDQMKKFNRIFTFLIPTFGLIWILGLLYFLFSK